MDAKSLAKSKRAHTQHHKKHHPNQKAKVPTTSTGASGMNKAVKEKSHQSQGPAAPALPSNWDRYVDEYDPMTESQTDGQSTNPTDVIVPKSKGADYAFLISEAKSHNSTKLSSEIFPSLDDFITEFDLGKGSFFAVRGESIQSSIQNDSFIVEDKSTTSYEASFLSLDLRALSQQLAKIDLPKRLFMEPDLFPPETYSKGEQERLNSNPDHETATYNTPKSSDHTSRAGLNPMVQPTPNSNPKSVANPIENGSNFKPETAEAELDRLLDSFADSKEAAPVSTSKKNTAAIDIDGTLDDLLNVTSITDPLDNIGFQSSSSRPVSKSELLDDFDSWLDTI